MKYSRIGNQSGQTMVEYVLVLLITLVVVLGVVYQLNQNFQNYARNYFGTYLRCLLESGELPNLGSTQDPNASCDADFQPFSLAFGRPPINQEPLLDPTNSNIDSSNRSASSSGSGGVSRGSGTSSNDPSGRSRTFNQSRPARLGSNTNLRNSRITESNNDSANSNADDKGGGKVTTKKVSRSGNLNETSLVGGGVSQGRPTYFSASKVEKEALQREQGVAANTNGEAGSKLRSKAIIQEQRKPDSTGAVEEEEFRFSHFLRYLLIAAILIAIILFLLGQFLSIQKSLEKN